MMAFTAPSLKILLTPPLPLTANSRINQLNHPPPLNLPRIVHSSLCFHKKLRRTTSITRAVEESKDQESTESETKKETVFSGELGGEVKDIGAEIKKAIVERKVEKEDNLWSGVAAEIKEIEWPAFGKVLGIIGVLLGVIVGSSVVLLTVNAVLAELSNRVFAGKGVQDFFS